MATKHIFVTVGTTKFDPFISKVLHPDSLKIMRERGYGSINVQIGSGDVEPISGTIEGVDVTCFRFLPSIYEEIHRADLVISHAGAGTCLEVLNAQKPLIAVVNGDLMDDHQGPRILAPLMTRNGTTTGWIGWFPEHVHFVPIHGLALLSLFRATATTGSSSISRSFLVINGASIRGPG